VVPPLSFTFGNLPNIGWQDPTKRLADLARACEQAGFDRFAVTDAKFYQDYFVVMTACLQATETLDVESLVTEPYVRNVAVMATAIATMDDLSRGRAILGIGGGVESSSRVWVSPWGFDRPHPVDAVREAVDVSRRMWRGDEVTFRGKVVRVEAAKLGFTARPGTRVLIAARSPRMLSLAGEVAEIAHIATFYLNLSWQRRILSDIRRGAETAGRPMSSFEIDISVACSISADREAARRAAKRPAAKGILWTAGADPYALKTWTRPADFTVPTRLIEELSNWDFRAVPELPREIETAISDEILDDFAVAGTPRECAERIVELKRALPEITGVRVDAVPPLGGGKLLYDGYIEMMSGYAEMIRLVNQRLSAA
jgi:5,10-methylenetetrahydromethanopterin reductase